METTVLTIVTTLNTNEHTTTRDRTMGRPLHQETTLIEETATAKQAAAPLFASTWMAFFSLLRENLTTEREVNETQF